MGSPSNPRYTAAVHGLLARVPDDRQGVEASDQRKRKGMNPLSLITMIIKLFRNYHSFWILSNLPLRLHVANDAVSAAGLTKLLSQNNAVNALGQPEFAKVQGGTRRPCQGK